MYVIDYIMLAIGSMLGTALFLGAAYLIFLMLLSAWRYISQSKIEFDAQRQTLAIQAAVTRQQLLLADKSSALVYPQNGFMPVAYNSVMDGANNTRLLDLAAQRIDTLRLPENVPNHLHIVTHSDTEQTLNQGASVPGVTGALGGLDFLLPGSQSGKYRLLEEGDSHDDSK